MRNHHIVFEVLVGPNPGEREERYYCSGPIIALNEFHRQMQTTREMMQDRRTLIRPKLLPHEYKITRMFQKYRDSEGKSVMSDFDLPNTPNPAILEERQEKRDAKKADLAPEHFFNFYPDTKGEKPEDHSLPAQA